MDKKIKSEYKRYKSRKWESFWNFRHGFYPNTSKICGINEKNYLDFIDDIKYRKGHPYNGMYSSIIDNKLYLPFLLNRFEEYIPKYYYFKDKDGFLPLEKNDEIARVSVNDVVQKLREVGSFVCKRVADSLGRGFLLAEYASVNGEDQFILNKRIVSIEYLKNELDLLNDCIITETVKNNSYAAQIAPHSLNTIRFLCVWDDENKQFFVARVFHRFGCNESIVDNLGAGNGICVFVDAETGILKQEGVISKNGNEYPIFDEEIIHPTSNISLSGMKIPNYKSIKNRILHICNTHSYLRYIGLDVAVTDNGFKIIEINSLSSLAISQQRDGFLADSRLRKILKH